MPIFSREYGKTREVCPRCRTAFIYSASRDPGGRQPRVHRVTSLPFFFEMGNDVYDNALLCFHVLTGLTVLLIRSLLPMKALLTSIL